MSKRRRGRPKIDVPRQPNGQPARQTENSKAREQAIMSVALKARRLRAALDASNQDAAMAIIKAPLAALKLPWMGCLAGRACAREADVAQLWDIIQIIRRRRRSWLSAIGQTEFAAISSVQPVSDYTTSTDPAPPSDLRTPEEKAAAAEIAWGEIADALYAFDPLLIRYVVQLVVRDEDIAGPPLPGVLRLVQKVIGS